MVVGVDGCTNGWFAIALERGEMAGDRARQEINLARRPAHKLRFKRDDLLDALVTAVTAELCLEHGPIPPPPETDARGLPMEMVYWRQS